MKGLLLLALGLAVLLCGGCGAEAPALQDAPWQYVDTAMGTVIQQTVYCADGETAQVFFSSAMDLLQGLEQGLLSWRLESSETYRVNASAGKEEGIELSEEFGDILTWCLELYRDSEGAFDVAIGRTARLWDIDEWAAGQRDGKFQPPEPAAVSQALAASGSGRIRILEGQRLRIFLPEGMELDLGAAGKGLALERLKELLEEAEGISGAVISVGGSVLTYGTKPDGSCWRVGITDPEDTASNVGVLELEGQWCVTTSGDYERYVEAEGVRYHHILDPATGYPADSGVRSVTILSREGLTGDGLSTACFVLGPEKGLALADGYGAEVLFRMQDGEMIMSEGMERYYKEQ